MVRQYNSSRRKKAAEQTRSEIVQAALRLHWNGITGLEPLAVEAGCSLATLRKHFPNKEVLFQNCTRTFSESLAMPDLPALAGVADQAQRISNAVSELCRIHEAMFGYAWLAAHQRKDSPTLDAEMKAYEGLADGIAAIITPPGSPKAALVRGLLDFLTYRALRLSGKLSPGQTSEELTAAIESLIPGVRISPAPTASRRTPKHETR